MKEMLSNMKDRQRRSICIYLGPQKERAERIGISEEEKALNFPELMKEMNPQLQNEQNGFHT